MPKTPPERPPSPAQRAIYFRALATLFNAGVPLSRAFELLDSSLVGPSLGAASRRISGMLFQGHSLDRALGSQGRAFTRLHQQVVTLGVHTGKLHLVLLQLAEYEEHRQGLVGKLRAALVYPLVVLIVCLVFVVVVPTVAFQGLFQMLQESGQELSLLTHAVAGLATALRRPLTYLALAVVFALLWTACRRWLGRPGSQLVLARTLESLPVVGPALASTRLAQFSRALALVIASGYHLDRGLKVACDCCESPLLEEVSSELVERLRQGETLAECLQAYPLFPPLFWQSVRAGEESGEVGKMLEVLASMYELEVEERLSRLTSLLEPAVMIVLGLLTGVLVLACIKPMAAAFSNL